MADEPPKEEPKKEEPKAPVVEPPVKDNLPDKFKGKTAEEIVKSYAEMEKQLGERPTKEDFEKANTNLAQWQALGEIIKGNPALLKAIEEEVKSKTDTPKDEPKKDDVRESLTIRTIGEFEQRLGIDRLPTTERTAMHTKIGAELKELLDPDGKKTVQQIINDIPLDKLPRYLDKAYRLATSDDDKEKARLQGLLDARQNSEGIFGSIPSGSAKSDAGLTPEQRNVAKKLGIPEEKYLAQLKKDQAN